MPRPRDPGSPSRGSQQTNPHAREAYKKPGEHLTALSLCAEARGLFLQVCRDPATQVRTRVGSANNPSVRTKRMCEGRTKKSGGPLTALSLRAEARGLFLQTLPRPSDLGSHARARQTTPPSERKGCARVALPATRSKTSNPISHSGARQNAIKGIEPVTVQGFEGWAPKGFDSRPRATESGTTMGEPALGRDPSRRLLGTL